MLGLKETVDWLAIVNGVRWYAYVLRRDENIVLTGSGSEWQKKTRMVKKGLEDSSGRGWRRLV